MREFLVDSFDRIDGVLRKMTEKDRMRADFKFSPKNQAYILTAHHRGQAIVYLRVKRIAPPAWKFEPKGA